MERVLTLRSSDGTCPGWPGRAFPSPHPAPRSMLHRLCGLRAGVRDPGAGQTVSPPLPRGVLQGAEGASCCNSEGQEGSSLVHVPAEGPRAGFAPSVTLSRGAMVTPKQVRSWSFQSLRGHTQSHKLQSGARPPVFSGLEVGESPRPTAGAGASAATPLPQLPDLADPRTLGPGYCPDAARVWGMQGPCGEGLLTVAARE